MKTRAIYSLVAILLSMATIAPSEAKTRGKKAHLDALLKRCNDGIAVSCYDYGVQLSRTRNRKQKQKGHSYIHRACTLAYKPACKMKLNNIKSQTRISPTNRCDMTTTAAAIQLAGNEIESVVQGSVWYRAGVQPGDKVISLNDKPFHGYDQVAEELGTGAMVLNVDRGGKPTSLMISCP